MKHRFRFPGFLRSPYGVIGLVGLLCHGLLLLTDYKIWDGWIVENWQRNHRFDVMWRLYSEAGIQHHFFIHRFIGFFGWSVWLYKVLSVCCYLGIACCLFHLTTRTRILKTGEALVIAIIMLTFPGMMTLGEAAVFPYVSGLFFFFLGACIAIHAEFLEGRAHLLWRLAAVSLFLIGFTYYAALVFYLAFYLLLLWFLWRHRTITTIKDMALIGARRADYLVLPIVFWKFKTRFMHTFGQYADYNQPHLEFDQFTASFHSLLSKTLFFYLWHFDLNILAAIVIAAATIALVRRPRLAVPASYLRPVTFVGAGIALVLLGGFPFVVVGRIFASSGYGSNYSLFTPIGGAFIIAGVIGLIRKALAWDRNGRTAAALLAVLVASFICTWNRNYLHWQALSAKDRSVAHKLSQSSDARRHTIFQIFDQFPIELIEEFHNAVRSVQMQDAFGDQTRFGMNVAWGLNLAAAAASPYASAVSSGLIFHPPGSIPIAPQLPVEMIRQKIESTTIPYCFEKVDVHGRQALLIITPGELGNEPSAIGLGYLAHRFLPFLQAETFDRFINGVTTVNLYSIATPLPPGGVGR